MIGGGDDDDFRILFVHQFPGKPQIFFCGYGFLLHPDFFHIHAPFHRVICHGPALRDILSRPLPSGHDQQRIGIVPQKLDPSFDPVPQKRRDLCSQDSGAQYDDVVRISLLFQMDQVENRGDRIHRQQCQYINRGKTDDAVKRSAE